jgi:hypothetical protein
MSKINFSSSYIYRGSARCSPPRAAGAPPAAPNLKTESDAPGKPVVPEKTKRMKPNRTNRRREQYPLMNGGHQTSWAAKIRIALCSGPCRADVSSHTPTTIFNLLGRNSGFLGLFQDRKNFLPANHKTPPNQSGCYLLSPACCLPIRPSRLIALNRGKSRLKK